MAVTIPIISEFDGKGVSRAIEEFKSLETVGQKASFALKKAAIPAAAAIGGLAVALGGATKAAMEDQAAQVQLAGVLERSAAATEQDIAATEAFISSLSRATAVADDDLRPALAQLVQATGSLEQSQQLLVQAQDISASTGKDLATVTDALSKAYNGNMRGLRALDASLIPLISDGLTFTEVMDVLAYTTGGAAADAAQTAEGRMRNLSIQIGEAKESIGAALLPVVAQLIDKLIPLAEWVQQKGLPSHPCGRKGCASRAQLCHERQPNWRSHPRHFGIGRRVCDPRKEVWHCFESCRISRRTVLQMDY
jgi:hypothetical protein